MSNVRWWLVLVLMFGCGGNSSRDPRDSAGSGGAEPATAGGSSGRGTGVAAGSGAAPSESGSGAMSTAGGMEGGTCGPAGCVPDLGGSPLEPPGPVLCGGRACGEDQACCLATSECFDPSSEPEACPLPMPDEDPWGRETCSSNAHCGPQRFCQIDSGLCRGTGHCQPISNCGQCFGDEATCRVCGCDGNTYPNVQTACLSGTTVIGAYGAGCGEVVEIGGGGKGGVGEGTRTFRVCGKDADCEEGDSCCAITGRCYPADEPDQCRMPPLGTRAPCTSDAQCEPHEYCSGDGCSGPGGCVPIRGAEECGVTLEPVCGCDGTTYTNAACAASRGVRVRSNGACD